MSRPQPPSPGGAAVDALLGDLVSYYWEGAGDGQVRVCRQAALTHRAQRLLDTGVSLGLCLSEDRALALEGSSPGDPSPAQDICPELVPALEFLELISVNLLLFPWRKEIKSLKTYTGSFAYWVRPVLSEYVLDAILGRLGYMATSETEFSLVQPISEEDAKQMVFEVFLARVRCESAVRTTGQQVHGPDRERLPRLLSRRGSERRLGKARNRLRGTWLSPGVGGPQQGPSEEAGSERALDEGTEGQCSLLMPLKLPEASTGPNGPRHNRLVSLGPQCHASTRLDSEEFLTCYSDLALHQTPLFPRDLLLSTPQGNQLQDPNPTPSPLSDEMVAPSNGSGGQPLVTVPSHLCLTPGPQSPKAKLEQAIPGPDAIPPSTSSEIDELCQRLSHLLGPPTLASHPGGFPDPGLEDKGQPEPHMGPEPASEGGSPDRRGTGLWRSPQAPSHVREPPSTHSIPLGALEESVPTRGHHPGNG